MFWNHFLQIGRDEGFDHDRARCVFPVQDSEIEKLLQSVIRQQRSDLIAAD